MNKFLLSIAFLGFSLHISAEKKPDYTNPKLPVERRVADLMARMTTEEKVAQMCQYVGIAHMIGAKQALTAQELEKSDASGFYPGYTVEDIREMTRKGLIGSFLHVVTAEEANYLHNKADLKYLCSSLLMLYTATVFTEVLPFTLHPLGRQPHSHLRWLNRCRAKPLLRCVLVVCIGPSRRT